MNQLKVLLVDDHAMFREGIRLLLAKLEFHCELLEADTCTQGIDFMEEHADLGLVLLDLAMPDASGMDALQLMRTRFSNVPVVVLSGSEDRAVVLEAVNRGAMGFISKGSSSAVLANALQMVFSGNVYLPQTLLCTNGKPPSASLPGLTMTITGDKLASTGLTARQVEIVQLLVQGLPNKLIARQLKISLATVKTHVAASLYRLNVRNRTQAVFVLAKLAQT